MRQVRPAEPDPPRERQRGPGVWVTCSFCGGQGKDPYGVMSWLANCCVCGGRGMVQVAAAHQRCAHCRGSGAVKTFTCTVCGGRGYVPLGSGPHQDCPDCRGTGSDPASALACLTCRGWGRVPRKVPKP